MVRWADLETAAPELAAEGRRLLYARGDGEALLVTVRGNELPRIHPVNVGVVEGGLYVFLLPSAKRSARVRSWPGAGWQRPSESTVPMQVTQRMKPF